MATPRNTAGLDGWFGWLADFGWENGTLVLRETGVRLPLSPSLISEAFAWSVYLAILGTAATASMLRMRPRPAIWFTPQTPRPWYLVRGAALWAGVRAARSPAEADVSFYFEDSTTGLTPRASLPTLNGKCTDIRKSHVAATFEEVFARPLTLDPRAATGSIVEKSEKNGVHDGRVVEAPCIPRQGHVYQRCLDTTDAAGACHDLRTLCVGGKPFLVWEKVKPAGARFSINNTHAALRSPEDVFSHAEMDDIGRFCARMGLDWGGLDILRDRRDGEIYIVDVNKTDLGPVIALSWRDKVRSMGMLGEALRDLVSLYQAQASGTSPIAVTSGAASAR